MFSIFRNIFKKSYTVNRTSERKVWAKVEDKSDGPLSWTEYTDHNGYVYTIFDMMIEPGFSEAKMKEIKQ
jgi:hypothetical protein